MSIIGIGTDIIECDRIAGMIEKHGNIFIERVFTPREIEYCDGRKSATQHYAGRWAAKEAVLKAMGTGWSKGIHWTDIEVINEMGGKPNICLGGVAREKCDEMHVTEMLISISHCKAYATAYALAFGSESVG